MCKEWDLLNASSTDILAQAAVEGFERGEAEFAEVFADEKDVVTEDSCTAPLLHCEIGESLSDFTLARLGPASEKKQK